MYRILGFVGPSGCGKDTAAFHMGKRRGYHYVTLCTTRPKRNEADNGYHFLTDEEFLQQVLNGDMLNAQRFRDWYYGLNKDGLVEDKINVLPMSNVMVEQMLEEKNADIDLKIAYIHTNPKERLLHIIDREEEPDCEEVCRRFLSDEIDYTNNANLLSKVNVVIDNNYNSDFYATVNSLDELMRTE